MSKDGGMRPRAVGSALIPFGVFVGIYLATGIYLDATGVEMAFYQLPAPIAALAGVLAAFMMFGGSADEKLHIFLRGCGHENIMVMCFIYLFAGAFTSVSAAIGGVESVVNLGMSVIPPSYIAAGMFVISAFIATATGTSVGTVVAVTPIAVGLAEAGNVNVFLTVAAAVGGGMFGDNLSMISDTTIAASVTQGCEMKDIFRANFKIAFTAALISVALLLAFGKPDKAPEVKEYSYSLIRVLPYVSVLVTAVMGVNVFAVLSGGIIFSGAIGIFCGDFTLIGLARNMYSGFEGMFEIFLLSMVIGGLAAMVQHEGGLEWALQKVRGVIRNKRGAELGLGAMVTLADMATANNTVSILITGKVAREIGDEYGISPKRTASVIDIFSCAVQGVLPYSAQILMACSMIPGLNSPFELISCCWYQFILAGVTVIFILVTGNRVSEEY